MDDNTKNTQASDQDGQQEKQFTQADVDRIINNRIARMKQDAETAETYRQERDDARRELEQYKNNAFLKSKGIRADDMDYVMFKINKLVDDKTTFQQAAEKFLKENPRFTGPVYRVSAGISNTSQSSGSGGEDDDIRKAMGLKG